MEKTSEFTVFTKHTIGDNSLFDTDMDLIEMFVRCFKQPDNRLAQSAVFNYYISQALLYWTNLEDLLRQNQIPNVEYKRFCGDYIDIILKERAMHRQELYESYIYVKGRRLYEDRLQEEYPIPDDYWTATERKLRFKIPFELLLCESGSSVVFEFIKKHFYKYEKMFKMYVELAQTNFDATHRYSFVDIFRIFNLIANLRCIRFVVPLDYIPEDIGKTLTVNLTFYRDTSGFFLLTNKTGWFHMNTYLYALFEGITLLGMPAGTSEYDGITGCPIEFFKHDLGHHDDMIYEYFVDDELSATGKFLREIYYDVLSDDNLVKDEKEACIFIVWFLIHEYSTPKFQGITFTTDVSILKTKFLGLISWIYDPKVYRSTSLRDFYPGSENFNTIEDCLIFTYNYIIEKYNLKRDDTDYMTHDDIKTFLEE